MAWMHCSIVEGCMALSGLVYPQSKHWFLRGGCQRPKVVDGRPVSGACRGQKTMWSWRGETDNPFISSVVQIGGRIRQMSNIYRH